MDKFEIENGKLIKYNGSDARVEIPNSVKSIGSRALGSCDATKEIIIPDSVECIDDITFINCKSLESVIISDSVRFSCWNWKKVKKLEGIISDLRTEI